MPRLPIPFGLVLVLAGLVILAYAAIFKAGNGVAVVGVGLLLVALIWSVITRRRHRGIGGDRDRPAFLSSRWFDDDHQDDMDDNDRSGHHGHHH